MPNREIRPPQSFEEEVAWLRLARSENVGPVTFLQLLRHYQTAEAALDALPALARRGGMRRGIAVVDRSAVLKEIDRARRCGARLLTLGMDDYPQALAMLETPPPLLWVRGHTHLLQRPAVAIVGARNASAAGRRMAETIARGLGQAELLVVSGLARGIDAAAHAASLETGTAAVLAGGVDTVYPPENARLHDSIAEAGVVLSEMGMGMQPQARHFPRRNRIISGMSYGVVVIEAARQSGSLGTARFAADQGREVMAVPGSPLDPRCFGSNRLLQEGASLVQTADDVVDLIRPLLNRDLMEPDDREPLLPLASPPGEKDLADARSKVMELLGPTPIEIDDLIRQSGLTPQIVSMILLELELAGRLERLAGHQVAIT